MFLNGCVLHLDMNKRRFIIVGVLLGTIITVAFFMGSPMFGNFDQLR